MHSGPAEWTAKWSAKWTAIFSSTVSHFGRFRISGPLSGLLCGRIGGITGPLSGGGRPKGSWHYRHLCCLGARQAMQAPAFTICSPICPTFGSPNPSISLLNPSPSQSCSGGHGAGGAINPRHGGRRLARRSPRCLWALCRRSATLRGGSAGIDQHGAPPLVGLWSWDRLCTRR